VPLKDLLYMTGMAYNNLLALLQKLRKAGLIESPGKGVYRLTDAHDR
jgi:DNA-binding IscR family transcriptional regulator